MHHARGSWLGVIVCAAVVLLLPVQLWASEGGGGLINLDKSLLVQMVNFVILLLILQRLLYRPLLGKMEERTQAIQRSLEEAQYARAAAARQPADTATRLGSAHAAAGRTRHQARNEAG